MHHDSEDGTIRMTSEGESAESYEHLLSVMYTYSLIGRSRCTVMMGGRGSVLTQYGHTMPLRRRKIFSSGSSEVAIA